MPNKAAKQRKQRRLMLNKKWAKDLAVSVLPTPVGPKNKKVPKGLVGSLKPALERIIVLDIADNT